MNDPTGVSPFDKVSKLPAKAARWVYWNGGVHRWLAPQQLKKMQRAYKQRAPWAKSGGQAPIIVYQMGKVGSSTISASLKALDLDVPVYHVHYLNYIDKYEAQHRAALPTHVGNFSMIETGRAIRRAMDLDPLSRWDLVSLVRTPIPAVISSFFQNIERHIPDYDERRTLNNLSAREVVDQFVSNYRDKTPLFWFDRQVYELFGIDVFANEFPRDRGYQTYEKNNKRLLVIRLEDLNRIGSGAIREFLHLPEFKLINRNVGQQKEYAELYREFQDQLRLPPNFVHEYNDSKYARHFYSEAELAKSVQRWFQE